MSNAALGSSTPARRRHGGELSGPLRIRPHERPVARRAFVVVARPCSGSLIRFQCPIWIASTVPLPLLPLLAPLALPAATKATELTLERVAALAGRSISPSAKKELREAFEVALLSQVPPEEPHKKKGPKAVLARWRVARASSRLAKDTAKGLKPAQLGDGAPSETRLPDPLRGEWRTALAKDLAEQAASGLSAGKEQEAWRRLIGPQGS